MIGRQQFEIKPSRSLATIFALAHGAALAALIPLAFPAWAKAALALVILFSLWHHLRRDTLLSEPSSCTALVLEKGAVALTLRDGKSLAGTVSRDSVVTPLLTLLNIKTGRGLLSRSVIILPDSMDAESFRRLRVWLKWGE
jgi:toxin CptA